MKDGKAQGGVARFGTYELDASTGELRKDGKSRPKIRDQALQILLMLIEKPQEVVTREEIREQVWPADTFVDFDHGVNTAVNQVRNALAVLLANLDFATSLVGEPGPGAAATEDKETFHHALALCVNATQELVQRITTLTRAP